MNEITAVYIVNLSLRYTNHGMHNYDISKSKTKLFSIPASLLIKKDFLNFNTSTSEGRLIYLILERVLPNSFNQIFLAHTKTNLFGLHKMD